MGIEQGRSRFPDIGTYLLVGIAIGPDVQFIDMVPYYLHEEVVGRIPTQGGPQADRGATVEGAGRILVLPPAGGCDGGGRFAGGGDLHLPPPEHSCKIYLD